jgi:rod shape determining protein RodA
MVYFFDKRIISHFNFELIVLILPLGFLSHYLVLETSTMLAHKQNVYYLISFIIFLAIFIFPFRSFSRFIPFFYWIGIFLLLLVEFFGVTKLGAT